MRRPCFLQRRLAGVATVFAACALVFSGCSSPSKPTPTQVFDPPVVSCPEPQTPRSLLGDPISVVYGDATAAKGKPPVTIACDPPSGNVFPIGDTTVTCVATDSIQRSNSCTFLVTVLPPLKLSVTRFVAFGDSITLGNDGVNSLRLLPFIPQTVVLPASQTYPGVLLTDLQERYTTQKMDVSVCNLGVGGEFLTRLTTATTVCLTGNSSGPTVWTTPQRLSNVLSGRQYDAVLLMEGSNDLGDRDSVVEANAIMALGKMVRDAKSRGVRPYLATIPPKNPNACCPNRSQGYALVEGFNDQIRSLAASEGVPLVDIYQALNTDISTYISSLDGLHPTVEGYAKIADLFLTSIEQTLEVPPPSSSVRATRPGR